MEAKNSYRIDGDVVWIKLTQGKETCVDLADWPLVSQYRWFAERSSHTFYAATNVKTVAGKRLLRLHTLLTGFALVDHRDGDGLNNCRSSNLRSATDTENKMNRGKQTNNTSGFKGVFWEVATKNWRAQLRLDGETKYLGVFDTAEKAARIYDSFAVLLHGEFAKLNFPTQNLERN